MKEEALVMSAGQILDNRKNSVTIDIIMNRFNSEHENSVTEIVFVGTHISDELKLQLFNLGFKYRKHIDPIGLTCHVISCV